TEDECEEPGWAKDVWSLLIPTRMSILAKQIAYKGEFKEERDYREFVVTMCRRLW
ncbi:hypothetical protein A2U01_0063493, partial [Trifolium medium]|nr:hypothetical protein [Trifolium medium]